MGSGALSPESMPYMAPPTEATATGKYTAVILRTGGLREDSQAVVQSSAGFVLRYLPSGDKDDLKYQ